MGRRLLALAGALFGWACASQPAPRPEIAGPCVPMSLWSNGWHTDIAFPASALAPDHPVRRLAPDAEYFLVGWGERAFYQSNGGNLRLAFDAVIPPSPSTLQIVASHEPAERTFAAKETLAFGLTPDASRGLADFLVASMVLDAAGGAIVIGSGHAPGRSWFVEGREGFHLFKMCNRWTAEALAAGGLDVSGGFGWSADAIANQVRRAPVCADAR